MSWYAQIEGELETALAARPLVRECFGPWMQKDSDGKIVIERQREEHKLALIFCGAYRNLGRHIENEVYKIARAYPRETKGELHLFSSDGDYFHKALRAEEGKLYRRLLGPEERIFPRTIQLGDDTLTIFVSAAERKESVQFRSRAKRAKRRRGDS